MRGLAAGNSKSYLISSSRNWSRKEKNIYVCVMGEKNPSVGLYKDRKPGITYLAGVQCNSSVRLFPSDYHTVGIARKAREKLSTLLKA